MSPPLPTPSPPPPLTHTLSLHDALPILRTYSLPPRRRNSPSVAPTEAHPVHRTLSVGCHHGVMRITHLGHACVLVEAAGTRVLIDPGSFSDLWHGVEDLNAILITHQHADHIDPEHTPALMEDNPQAVVYTADDVHRSLLLPRAEPATAGETFTIGGLEVEAVGGNHAVIHADIPRVHNIGFVLRAEGEPVFFHPGDALDSAPS